MELPRKFVQNWKQRFTCLPADSRLLVAVSGGIDSVVLVHLMQQAGMDFVLAHCNFGLRGAESLRDEQFVRALAMQYGRQVLVQQFDTAAYAQQHRQSIQEAARALRYQWFAQLIQATAAQPGEAPFRAVATAHQANDNIETLLFHFFRGTGIGGLHGILPVQGNIIRPLLFAKRQEIAQYAHAYALQWVEDSSNDTDQYTRNYFRHRLIPAVQEVFPQAEDQLLQNIERFGEVEQLYRQAVAHQLKKLPETRGNELHVPVLKLQQLQPLHTLTWELIKPYGFHAAQVNEVIRLLQAGNGSYVASASWRIIRNRQWLIIAPLENREAQHILVETADREVLFPLGRLLLEKKHCSEEAVSTDAAIACLDADLVHYPLLLRPWKQGDYFYPLGMRKKKKLSRFLIDQKLSRTDKEKVWVLEAGNQILWIAGYRIDDRFKLRPSSKTLLRISLQVPGH